MKIAKKVGGGNLCSSVCIRGEDAAEARGQEGEEMADAAADVGGVPGWAGGRGRGSEGPDQIRLSPGT